MCTSVANTSLYSAYVSLLAIGWLRARRLLEGCSTTVPATTMTSRSRIPGIGSRSASVSLLSGHPQPSRHVPANDGHAAKVIFSIVGLALWRASYPHHVRIYVYVSTVTYARLLREENAVHERSICSDQGTILSFNRVCYDRQWSEDVLACRSSWQLHA